MCSSEYFNYALFTFSCNLIFTFSLFLHICFCIVVLKTGCNVIIIVSDLFSFSVLCFCISKPNLFRMSNTRICQVLSSKSCCCIMASVSEDHQPLLLLLPQTILFTWVDVKCLLWGAGLLVFQYHNTIWS